VKHQRGIVGADMASILAKRNQSTQIRTAQRTAAIQKAKSEKKEKEAKKTKAPRTQSSTAQNLKAAGEGWEGPLMGGSGMLDSSYALSICIPPRNMRNAFTCTREGCSPQFFRQFGEY